MMNGPIGVFDSGIGGLTVLKELADKLPYEDFIYYADSANAPYGPKSANEIISLSESIVEFLISQQCKLVVVACNTATAAAVWELRSKFQIPIIGLEPAVKPACLNTKTGNVGVLATEGTFRGNHFKTTSDNYKDYVTIHLQVAKGLVELAENGVFEGEEVNKLVNQYVKPFLVEKIDQLVLGCTHYPFFYKQIKDVAGDSVDVIDSAGAVARRTKDVLMRNKIFRTENNTRRIIVFSSGHRNVISKVVRQMFNVGDNCCYVEIKYI
jgi:glutamate racemase